MTVYDVTLPEEAADSLRRALGELAGHPRHAYPWAGLEGGVRLVGYGSLLNAASAARTLTTARRGLPIVAFGARRLFDYVMTPGAEGRYGTPPDPRARAALNVRLTGALGDAVNGLLFDVPAGDVEALRLREIDYDLEPVVCLPWQRFDESPFVAHILTCPARSLRQRGQAPADGSPQPSPLLPHPHYYQVCREGAASVSEEFLRFFLASTFLADGLTSATEWEPAGLSPS